MGFNEWIGINNLASSFTLYSSASTFIQEAEWMMNTYNLNCAV